MFRTAPTGIDRVEYAYARELLGADEAIGVLTTPLFTGALRRSRALDVLARVERAWNLGENESTDRVFQSLKLWLEAPFSAGAKRAARFVLPDKARSFLREADFFPARDLIRAKTRLQRWLNGVECDTVYFHCSHTQLDRARSFNWLAKRQIASVFFIHDAIPIEYPEFCSPGADERHVKRLMTVSKFASLIIVNSEQSRRAVRRALNDRGAGEPRIEVVPLGIEKAFCDEPEKTAIRCTTPYFLCVGTIEPRKNLLFLLEVWRRLVEGMGENAPRLVVAGRRGWENENIVDVLERSRTLAPFVAEASDLTDAGLAALMANAAALVAPSFAEGFGLPIVETLATGTPVIASDIPAHREVGGAFALYADPIDGRAWISAIETMIESEKQYVTRRPNKYCQLSANVLETARR